MGHVPFQTFDQLVYSIGQTFIQSIAMDDVLKFFAVCYGPEISDHMAISLLTHSS